MLCNRRACPGWWSWPATSGPGWSSILSLSSAAIRYTKSCSVVNPTVFRIRLRLIRDPDPYNQSKRRNHQLSAIFCFTRRKKSFSNKFTTVPLYLSALSFLPDLDPKQMVSVPGKSSGSNRIRIYDLQHCIKIINIIVRD